MKTLKIVMVILIISLMLPSSFALAHSGGGGGGGGGGDDDNAFAMGGAVSWGGHPGYPDVMGSSVWDCNPVGPFQEGTAIEKSVQDLIDGYQDGTYTKDDVRDSLAWAEGVGISVNSKQRGQLDNLMNPPPPKNIKKSEDSKLADNIEKGLNLLAGYYETKKNNGGKSPSRLQLAGLLTREEVKSRVSREDRKYVDKVYDLLGF